MKKIIKVILTTCMLLTCFTMNIIADGPEDLVIDESTSFEGGFKECNNFKVSSGATLTLTKNESEESPYISVWGNIAIEGTLVPCQDAVIRVQPGCEFSGIKFWDPIGVNEITSIENPVDFVYLEEMGKWVQGLEDKTFDVNSTINTWCEYGNVTINTGVTLSFTNSGYLCVRGSFVNQGLLNPVDRSIIALDNSAFSGITLYEADGITTVATPVSGYIEFIYLGSEGKWVRYIRPNDVAIEYDEEKGEVYHYVDNTLTYIKQEWKDDGEGPYYNFFYQMDGEDTFYIKAKEGFVFDHIEAEGDDPQSQGYPDNRIINEINLPDETIGGTKYKVVKVTTNPKDDNFYFFCFNFLEDPDVANRRLAEKLNTLELAIDSDTGAANSYLKLKEYIANSVYEKYLVRGSRHFIDNTVFAGDDFTTFKGKVIIVEDAGISPTKTPAQIDGNPATYFKFKLDGLDNFVGIVYKINGTDKFILRDGNTYSTIDVTTESKEASEGKGAAALKDFDAVKGGRIVVRKVNNTVNREESEEVPNYEIFGNFAGFPMNYTGWMQDSQDTNYISLERVWPCAGNGIDVSGFGAIGCELILYSNDFLGVCVKSSEKAKPWSKENLPIYPTNSGEEEATVFFASDSVEITSPYEAPANSTITNITFDGGLTSWNGCSISKTGGTFTITFGSIFYDKVPLQITYSNGESRPFVIARTGLSIGDYPAPGGSDRVDVCGETVIFTDDNRWLIAAQYYYDSASPSDRVSLFAKITEKNGNVVSKLITNTINNSGIHTDDADDYTYRKYDVFELWRGKADNRPQKIEVIAFVQGSGNDFGGVKLGSGNGIKWTQERGRQ